MKSLEQFGATAVRLGYATPGDVSKVLQEQHVRRVTGKAPSLIGTLMKEMGILSPEQIGRVLKQLASNRIYLSEDGIRLAARLKATLSEHDKVVVITGAAHGDGVSSAAAQVGVALALMGEGPVLVVDANVRAPSQHFLFGITQMPGLADVLSGRVELESALQASSVEHLSVLTSGNSADDFLSLLMSQTFTAMLDDLRGRFRFILVDTPPLLLYPESALLVSRGDGVVVVLKAWERGKSELLEMKHMLAGLCANFLGVVLSDHAKQPGRNWLRHR